MTNYFTAITVYFLLGYLLLFAGSYTIRFITSLIVTNMKLLRFFKFLSMPGVVVHEISHAIVAILFSHKITTFNLFSWNSEHGVLGRVVHTYDKRYLYQNVGLFFVSLAPLIGGLGTIFLTGYVLDKAAIVEIGYTDFGRLIILNRFDALWGALFLLVKNHHSIGFYLWVLVSLMIAPFSFPSFTDIKNSFVGFMYLYPLVLVMGIPIFLFEIDVTDFIEVVSAWSIFALVLLLIFSAINMTFLLCIRFCCILISFVKHRY